MLDCKPADIKRFIQRNPAAGRMTPGIERLIMSLQARGKAVYLISGGFREVGSPARSCASSRGKGFREVGV